MEAEEAACRPLLLLPCQLPARGCCTACSPLQAPWGEGGRAVAVGASRRTQAEPRTFALGTMHTLRALAAVGVVLQLAAAAQLPSGVEEEVRTMHHNATAAAVAAYQQPAAIRPPGRTPPLLSYVLLCVCSRARRRVLLATPTARPATLPGATLRADNCTVNGSACGRSKPWRRTSTF
jgi:hypothetical protein